MPLRVKCPAGHALIVPDDRAGRTLRCPRCGESVVVPGGRDERHVTSDARGKGSAFRVQGSEEIVEKAVATLLEVRFPEPAPAPPILEERPPEPVVKPKSRAIARVIPPPEATPPERPPPETPPPQPAAPEPVALQPPPPVQVQEEPGIEFLPAAREPPPVEPLSVEPEPVMAPPPMEIETSPLPVVEQVQATPPAPIEPALPASEPTPIASEPAPPPLADVQPTVSAALHADASRTLAVYQLAAALAIVALFSVAPAVWDVIEYLQTEDLDAPFVARWALVLFFLGVVQLAYAVYLFQLPDWTSVWVVTVWLLVLAFGYAGVLGVVLISQADGFLVGPHGLQLADKLAGGQAALWCLCMVSVATILAFFAGRMSVQWRRAERMLRVAGY
jgi:hypothetical protein